MQKHEIKLIALDIDGTIMNSDYHISARVKRAISAAIEQGVHVVLATGRMYSATVPIAKELGLKTPLIIYQGSMVREFYKSDEILLHHNIPTDTSCELINDLKQENIQINAYWDDKLFVENTSSILEEYATRRKIPYYPLTSFEEAACFRPTKIMAMDSDIKKIDAIKNKYAEKYDGRLNVTKSTDYFCEFVDAKCSKAGAIKFLADRWAIQKPEIMAIGDQDNDKEMILAAGVGVAMGNSHEDLQEAANYITETVDNDGAAIAIEKIIKL